MMALYIYIYFYLDLSKKYFENKNENSKYFRLYYHHFFKNKYKIIFI